MNVLVVDDQKEVVSGLINGLHWKDLKIDGVYHAYCPEEARHIFLTEQCLGKMDCLCSDG